MSGCCGRIGVGRVVTCELFFLLILLFFSFVFALLCILGFCVFVLYGFYILYEVYNTHSYLHLFTTPFISFHSPTP